VLACLATSNFKCSIRCPSWAPPAALLRKYECLQITLIQKGVAWKAVAQRICPWPCLNRGTETGAACLSCHLKLQTYLWGSLPGSLCLALKMRTSPDSSEPEGANLESYCSASAAHGTARTKAQKLGLLACLATSNFKRSPRMGCVPAVRLQ